MEARAAPTGAPSVHSGYGFLSKTKALRACVRLGETRIVFIGPPVRAIGKARWVHTKGCRERR
ncbi:biotin carboxylase N-terminal domain-containing protein [Paraburkholderia dipogonis]|uniref:biotin carboxylase N-terminal domain-containing protein n=1 Tax=Paraburkholderia dipogonis TaxID=1211383 RepID=UPI0035EE137A